MNAPSIPDTETFRACSGRMGHRVWRMWAVLLLALSGLLWLAGQATAVTMPADVAGVQVLAAPVTDCGPGTWTAADMEAERGDLADLDMLWAVPRAMSAVRLLQRFDLHTSLIVFGVQPGLPPPRHQG